MEADFRRAELTYEVYFLGPSFELPGLGTLLLQSLYENIHPLYPLNTSDMRVLGGNSLSDVRVQVTAFGGLGLIDVRSDGITMSFRGLQNPQDFATCLQCISLSEEATSRVLPNCQTDGVALRPTLYLDLEGEARSASDHLATVLAAITNMDLQKFGNPVLHPGVNLEMENTEQGWNAIFNAYRDRGEQSLLVVSCFAQYGEQGAIQGLEQRFGHLKQLIRTVLRGIGVEASSPFWEAE